MNIKWGLTPFIFLFALAAWAQNYPDRPIRFYVGFPPGGSTDLVSRYLGQKLSERLKQPVIVEQKTGATGLLANDAVAKAAPDGHTMVLLTGGHPGTAAKGNCASAMAGRRTTSPASSSAPTTRSRVKPRFPPSRPTPALRRRTSTNGAPASSF